MSADWHTFQTWLSRHGVNAAEEAWERFMELAHQSTHAEALAHIAQGAEPLPEVLLVPILSGVASLMTEIESPPEAGALSGRVAAALGDVLAELDLSRPTTVAAALVTDPPGQASLRSWSMAAQIAQFMLLTSPRSNQMLYYIAALCNLVVERLSSEVRERLQRIHDLASIQHATTAFGYALTRYTDAVRQLNEALGVVAFAEPPPLGTGVGAP